MNIKTMVKALEVKRVKLAKIRDELRDIVSDFEDEEARVSDALENIEIAIDRLSESV